MHKFVTAYMYVKNVSIHVCLYTMYIHVPCKVEAPNSYGWLLDGR